MILIVQCPRCNKTMKYQPKSNNKYNWTKRCPYCNKVFRVMLKNKPTFERIVKIIK